MYYLYFMRWWMHILFWLGIWIWMTLVYVYNYDDLPSFLLYNLLRLPVIICATYAVAKWVVEKQLFSSPPSYARAFWNFMLVFLSASLIDRIIAGNHFISPTVNGEELYYEFFSVIPIAKNTFLLLSIMLFGAVVQFSRLNSRNLSRISELQQEKLQNELAFLRSQVNPHFLFNTFNNLYAMAELKGHEELAAGLQGMSKLMRYLTYESNAPKVALTKEIELIDSFIALQRLRLGTDDDLSITFTVSGDPAAKLVAPVLLLPLVENAFKHGLPTWISIQLAVSSTSLVFEVKNRKRSDEQLQNGIGLENLKRRLNIIYPGRYVLDVENADEVFKSRLEVPVK